MELRIADTFTGSLARLAGEERKAAKTTAFNLQLNPARPGMRFHNIDGATDENCKRRLGPTLDSLKRCRWMVLLVGVTPFRTRCRRYGNSLTRPPRLPGR